MFQLQKDNYTVDYLSTIIVLFVVLSSCYLLQTKVELIDTIIICNWWIYMPGSSRYDIFDLGACCLISGLM